MPLTIPLSVAGTEFNLFVDSAIGVLLEPKWNFKDVSKKIETQHQAMSGRRYVYKWGNYEGAKFSVEYVDSATASLVNTWWLNNTNLLFQSAGDTAVTSCQIVNRSTPIDKFMEPYNDHFKGTIELRTY